MSLQRTPPPAAAFTLLEIMIVVAIIALLAAIALPAFTRARREARISAFVNDLRLARDAFEFYATQNGDYPPDVSRRQIPPGMAEYLPRMDWSAPTPLGGAWDWERDVFGIKAGISAVGPSEPQSAFVAVDRRLDDGNLASGMFQRRGDRYTYTLHP